MSSHPMPPDGPFATVAILGLGAMGGSLARALSGLEARPRIVGWSPVGAERDAAANTNAVDAAPSAWREAVAGADLVVVAAPLAASCELIEALAAVTPAETTLTDVASLKVPVARVAAEVGVQDRWVGAHPMTGSEGSGFAASRSDLYQGARVWTVAHASAKPRVERVSTFWRSVGARPTLIAAEDHDRLMALASHLPQLTSNALASVLSRFDVTPEELGPGGSDMTRLAGSNSAMWRDIFDHASPELLRGLDALAGATARIADLLRRGDLEAITRLMDRTREWSQGA
jgi:prephenate dehydrogenase